MFSALLVSTALMGDISLASDSDFYMTMEGRLLAGGQLYGAVATDHLCGIFCDSTGSGLVMIDGADVTYSDWSLPFSGTGWQSITFALPVGLGQADFTFEMRMDPWDFAIPGDHQRTLTQPRLGQFQTEGLAVDLMQWDDPVTGAWRLTGPTESAEGLWSVDLGSPFGSRDRWQGVQFVPLHTGGFIEQIPSDSIIWRVPTDIWLGQVDGQPFRLSLGNRVELSGGTRYVPEPSAWACCGIACVMLIVHRYLSRRTR